MVKFLAIAALALAMQTSAGAALTNQERIACNALVRVTDELSALLRQVDSMSAAKKAEVDRLQRGKGGETIAQIRQRVRTNLSVLIQAGCI